MPKDEAALTRAAAVSRRWVGGDDRDSRAAEADYDGLAHDYDGLVACWGYQGAGRVAELVLRHAPPSARVLDAGCGTGLLGAELSARGFADLTGLDVSGRSLHQARARGVYRELLRGDLQAPLPFPAGSFGAAGCAGVLTYVDELPVLAELRRVLSPGGVLVFSHREDLVRRRGLDEHFAALEAAGAWTCLERSGPEPYMPGHPDYAGHIRVIYYAYRAGAPSADREGAAR